MKKTIGVFAHVDAGKTTFSEQLLFHTGVIRQLGRVDHKDTLLDGHSIERDRGITIFSDQAYFEFEGDEYYLLDTPGHVDFSAEMERAIHVIDYAVIIISGIDGIQSHTETVYELLKKHQKPVFFFINKLDAGHANYNLAAQDIHSMTEYAVDFTKDYLEAVVEKDDLLLEHYLEQSLDQIDLKTHIKRLIRESKIMPVLGGSALKNEGIKEFLQFLHEYTDTEFKQGDLAGVAYKIKYDQDIRQTYIKLYSGTLKVREMIGDEKVTSIKKIQGGKSVVVDHLEPGDVGAVVGLTLKAGDGFGMAGLSYEMLPSMKAKLNYDSKLNPKDVFRNMKKLEDEDPALQIIYEEKTKAIHFGIMGDIQLEVLTVVIKERFDYEVTFDDPKIIYKETIANTVIGYGHFEPLKHYSEVHLKLEPGHGIEFHSTCSTDHLTVGNQNLVKHHIFEREHRGILTGSGLTNIKVTLLTGRAHKEHTSGGDFREATIRALRQGLEQAENILLEPIYEAVITVPNELMGKVMMDVTKAHGMSFDPIQLGEKVIVKAHVPVATFRNYANELASFSSGRGRVKLKVIDYKPCHNTDEVIENIGYDKITDDEYPSSSIFCSKGKGYTIKWDEAKEYMHC